MLVALGAAVTFRSYGFYGIVNKSVSYLKDYETSKKIFKQASLCEEIFIIDK